MNSKILSFPWKEQYHLKNVITEFEQDSLSKNRQGVKFNRLNLMIFSQFFTFFILFQLKGFVDKELSQGVTAYFSIPHGKE